MEFSFQHMMYVYVSSSINNLSLVHWTSTCGQQELSANQRIVIEELFKIIFKSKEEKNG